MLKYRLYTNCNECGKLVIANTKNGIVLKFCRPTCGIITEIQWCKIL